LAVSWSTSRLGGALYEDVVSLSAVDASTAYAVNSVGNVYRYSGSTWTLAASGSSYGTQFLSVSAVSGAAVAVGTNGVIVRFNGSSWSAMSSGTTATLNSVWMESSSSAFAVGTGGTAVRYNGSTWTSSSTGSTQTLNAVWSSGGTAVAVGTGGEIMRYSGSWSRQTSGTTETLYGVYGTSTSSVVAVGTFGTVLRYAGSSWSKIPAGSVSADLYGVTTDAGSGRSYIASDVGLLQLDGSSLSTANTPYAPRLFAASMDNNSGVWTSGQRGSVMRLGGSWQTLNLAPDLIDVWTTSRSDAWAVGEFGFTYRWNGIQWTRIATPTTSTLNTVWSSGSTAFAGGDNGTMLRWNGSAWSAMSFPSSANVYGLWGTSSTNVYAVTSAGQVIRYDGSSWTQVATSGVALWAIHGSSATDIVTTGESGVALRYNGTQWIPVNAATTGTLAGVWADGTMYLSVGANSPGTAGIAFSSLGSTWSPVSVGTTPVLTSLWGPTRSDLYATGDQGTILRYNGSGWTTMSTGTTDLFWSVSGASDGTGGFAVGYNSTLATATSGSSVVAMRVAGISGGTSTGTVGSLEPRTGAKLFRGALPTGKARELRKRR
jgi:hypothetical protein